MEGIGSWWQEKSAFGKLLASASMVMAILSLGSLSEQVFAFKGFYLDAIIFYRVCTQPLHDFFMTIGLEIHVDSLVFLLIVFPAILREFFSLMVTEGSWLLAVIVVLFCILMIVILAVYAPMDSVLPWFSIPICMYLIGLGYGPGWFDGSGWEPKRTIWMSDERWAKKLEEYEKDQEEVRRAFLNIGHYIVSIYLLVAVIAAISKGLMRVS